MNSALASASKKELESIVAEKLIYNYAIEMCQSAAVEELFGHPAEVGVVLHTYLKGTSIKTHFIEVST